MNEKRSKHSLRAYYFKYMCAGFSVILALMAGLATLSINELLENKVNDNLRNSLRIVSDSLQTDLSSLQEMAMQVGYRCLSDNTLYQLLTSESYYTRQQALQDLEDYVHQILMANKRVYAVACLRTDTRKLLFASTYLKTPEVAGVFALSDLRAGALPVRFQAPHASVYTDAAEHIVFSARLSMNIGAVGHTIPVAIYVESALELGDFFSSDSGCYTMQDQDGRIVYQSDETYDLNASYTVSTTMEPYGLTLEYAMRRAEYFRERDHYYQYVLWALAAALLIIVFLIWKFTGALIRPVRYILGGVNRLGRERGEAHDLAPYGYREFDDLIAHINETQHRIDQLIRELCQTERRKNEVQTLVLRAQINPHFLFNSLNAIQWMARLEGCADIDRYTESFTDILRYNLDKDGMMSTVDKELQIVRTYMTLLSARYGDHIRFTLEVQPEALPLALPKFVIQPFVENAIYHGLPDQRGNIRISVAILAAGQLAIEVADDGRGMSEAMLARLCSMEHWENGMGIGIRYVREMLQCAYGEEYTLEFVQSPEKSGLMIRMVINHPALPGAVLEETDE